jgi:hypothetical protein
MNAIANPSPRVSEDEGAYHAATADHGHDSAEALVAWWHWRETRRRACDGRALDVEQSQIVAL